MQAENAEHARARQELVDTVARLEKDRLQREREAEARQLQQQQAAEMNAAEKHAALDHAPEQTLSGRVAIGLMSEEQKEVRQPVGALVVHRSVQALRTKLTAELVHYQKQNKALL